MLIATQPSQLPWRLLPPQRNVGARRAPMGFAEPWLLLGATPVNGGSSPGRPGHPQTGGGAKGRPNQNRGFSPVAILGSFPLHHRLPKAACYLKSLVLPQHVIAGACQLVRQGLDRDNPVPCALLALVKALGFRARANGKVRRFDKCPRKILVAVLRVAFSFLPAVAFASAVHAATVRTEIADLGKTRNGSGFQHDRGRENRTNAGH